MRGHRSLLFLQLGLLLLITVSSQADPAQQGGGQEISFTVSMPRPQTHLLEVAIRIDRGLAAWPRQETLMMPVWTPGSYLIREFERQVQDFAALDDSGRPLEWEKINKNSWRVKTRRSPDDLSVRRPADAGNSAWGPYGRSFSNPHAASARRRTKANLSGVDGRACA